MSSHARLSPSSSDRWTRCPGSIRLSEGLENRETEYSAEGTVAHQLAERCLTAKTDAIDYLGVELKCGRFAFTVDEEMAAAIQVYIDWARSLPADAEIEYEQRLDLTHIHPDMWGTGDLVAYVPSERRLIVADLKFGRGIAVEPEENSQAVSYGIGAAHRLNNRGVTDVEIVIVQPRCPHPAGPIRTWKTDVVSLIEWSNKLRAGARATEATDAPLVAGDHCKFCPAAPTCPALRDFTIAAAHAAFTNDGSLLVADPSRFDADELAAAMRNVDVMESYCKRVREAAHHELAAGRPLPGFKLVATRAVRKWIDENKARMVLMIDHGLAKDEVYTSKFVSPAQAEKLVGKKAAAALVPLYDKVSSGTVVAPESDARPSVRGEAAAAFEGVPVQ